ncbi:MAG: type II secretion system protein [Candidatus Omnitrophica bacterium]|nr:type II secretion system protein [Candidatus Omnitrophota bacterium]MDD5430354.1 type II secretion system protein [Candidatus Omnitrophota bacterium]
MKKYARGGFTLIEILVGVILIALGFAAIIGIFLSGRYFLQQAENKAKAISVASMKMEELLAQSFGSLEALEPISTGIFCYGKDWGREYDEQNQCFADGGKPFLWQVEVSERKEGEGLVSNPVPYKYLEVDVSYSEDIPGRNPTNKKVYLENIIPYPSIHIVFQDWGQMGVSSPIGTTAPYVNPTFPLPDPKTSGGLLVNFNLSQANEGAFKVVKNIEVTYNIALRIEDSTNIKATDTIVTACYLCSEGSCNRLGIISRTPIVSQPLFNNIVASNTVSLHAGQDYQLTIYWYKDTPEGTIKLRDGNIIITAYEKR